MLKNGRTGAIGEIAPSRVTYLFSTHLKQSCILDDTVCKCGIRNRARSASSTRKRQGNLLPSRTSHTFGWRTVLPAVVDAHRTPKRRRTTASLAPHDVESDALRLVVNNLQQTTVRQLLVPGWLTLLSRDRHLLKLFNHGLLASELEGGVGVGGGVTGEGVEKQRYNGHPVV